MVSFQWPAATLNDGTSRSCEDVKPGLTPLFSAIMGFVRDRALASALVSPSILSAQSRP